METHEGAGGLVRSERPVRIVLADDEPVVRGGLPQGRDMSTAGWLGGS